MMNITAQKGSIIRNPDATEEFLVHRIDDAGIWGKYIGQSTNETILWNGPYKVYGYIYTTEFGQPFKPWKIEIENNAESKED